MKGDLSRIKLQGNDSTIISKTACKRIFSGYTFHANSMPKCMVLMHPNFNTGNM